MKLGSKSWQKRLSILFVAIIIYFLLAFIYFYVLNTIPPNECITAYVGSFGASGNIPCSIVEAYNFELTPLSTSQQGGNVLAGLGLIIWFMTSVIYIALFLGMYTLVRYIQKKHSPPNR